MIKKEHTPWASGPGEILRHGLHLLQNDSDSNRRIAMICIDNSIELMMKTFLGLPERISGIKVTRKDYAEFSESFPKVLDALEKYASSKITGIDLGGIEWYHRLRNELYHQGNGLTVEKNNVEVYAEIANLLFNNLFGFKLVNKADDKTKLLGDFMQAWINYEKILMDMAFIITEKSVRPLDSTRVLLTHKIIDQKEFNDLNSLRQIRNEIIHGKQDHNEILKIEHIDRLIELTNLIEKKTLEE
jgi:hypothetical protein